MKEIDKCLDQILECERNNYRDMKMLNKLYEILKSFNDMERDLDFYKAIISKTYSQ